MEEQRSFAALTNLRGSRDSLSVERYHPSETTAGVNGSQAHTQTDMHMKYNSNTLSLVN